jgi:hypothetical protein
MALHRDIHWIGRQWAVTGYGMQPIDQKHGGRFDIEIERLWDDDLLERFSEQKWFNLDDFSKGLSIARRRFPAPPRAPGPEPAAGPEPERNPPPRPVLPALQTNDVKAPPLKAAEMSGPEAPTVEPVDPAQATPPEDPLKKWFEAYGLNKTPPAMPPPEPPRAVSPGPIAEAPQQAEPIATVENAPTPDVPLAEPAEPPPPASSFMQMPISGRARFVRPWRVQIHAVQSYRL